MKPESGQPPPVDMSSEAIDQRFRMVEALRKLCVSLKEAGEQARRDSKQNETTIPANPSLTQRVGNS
jgi:hypothetical protein